MYDIIQHAHSGLRWVVLALILVAIFNAFNKWQNKGAWTPGDAAIYKYALLALHFQVLLGIIVYLISPKVIFAGSAMKDPIARFFLVEHLSIMLVAAILITIGQVRGKKKAEDVSKFKNLAIYYTIGLILILVGIPWPWQGLGTGWF